MARKSDPKDEPGIIFPLASDHYRDLLAIPRGSSSGFGAGRPYRHGTHMGNDYHVPEGTPILAVGDGRITKIVRGKEGRRSRDSKAYTGNMIELTFEHPEHGTVTARYMHLQDIPKSVKVGAEVKAGEIIGLTGVTGTVLARAHLHIDFKHDGSYIAPNDVLGKSRQIAFNDAVKRSNTDAVALAKGEKGVGSLTYPLRGLGHDALSAASRAEERAARLRVEAERRAAEAFKRIEKELGGGKEKVRPVSGSRVYGDMKREDLEDIRQKAHYILTGKDKPVSFDTRDKLKLQKDLATLTGLSDGLDDGKVGEKTARAAREALKILDRDRAAIARAEKRKGLHTAEAR